MSTPALGPGAVDFECWHSRGYRDQPPVHIPMFARANSRGARRGNARRDLREIAESVLDRGYDDELDWRTPTAPLPGEAQNDWIDRQLGESARQRAAAQQHDKALNMNNHHQIKCPTCSFTARLRGDDLETLAAWAIRNGVSSLPLTKVRRLLDLIAAETVRGTP